MAKPESKIFHDPIHGSMEFDSVLVKIIDTPEFQRLRRIKQLGGGCYVYPGATHTRFEHSLGVCHLAGKFVEHLKETAKDIPDIQIAEEDILCVKVAGLCHDLGHGPFSHMFEVFAHKAVPGGTWKHEDMSVEILEKVLTDAISANPNDQELKKLKGKKEVIAEMIKGSMNKTGPKHFLYQIVANKDTGVDVDKCDYFARDCHYLGLSNDFQWMRCMMLACVKKVGEPNDYQVCYRDSDIANIYAMFRTRSTLHQKAYQHIRVKAVEQMMIDCLLHVKDCTIHGLQKTLKEIIEEKNVAEYVKLDDSIVESFPEPVNGAEEERREAFGLIKRLRRRQLYHYLGFAKMKAENNLTEEGVRETLGIEEKDFVISVVKVKFGSEKENPLGKLWFYPKNGLEPFQLSREKSEQILLGGLLLPAECQPQHEVRFYYKGTEDYSCVTIKDRLKDHADVFGKLTGNEGYFSMTDGK